MPQDLKTLLLQRAIPTQVPPARNNTNQQPLKPAGQMLDKGFTGIGNFLSGLVANPMMPQQQLQQMPLASKLGMLASVLPIGGAVGDVRAGLAGAQRDLTAGLDPARYRPTFADKLDHMDKIFDAGPSKIPDPVTDPLERIKAALMEHAKLLQSTKP